MFGPDFLKIPQVKFYWYQQRLDDNKVSWDRGSDRGDGRKELSSCSSSFKELAWPKHCLDDSLISPFGRCPSLACRLFWVSGEAFSAPCRKWGHDCFRHLGGVYPLQQLKFISRFSLCTLRNQLLSHAQFRIIKRFIAEKRAVSKDKEQTRRIWCSCRHWPPEHTSYPQADRISKKAPSVFSPSFWY